MIAMPLSRIANLVGGRVVGDDVMVDVVATDTRAMPHGHPLFIALKGERFDGHDHLSMAARNGAVAALVSREIDSPLPQLIVADTERALAAFAAGVQRERKTKVIAITGSNGKTSVKTLVLAILREAFPEEGAVYANPGNFNNEIGLPLAVLAAPAQAHFAVYEMGAGKPGDITYLTAIARPDISVVNNIAPAHLERMGSLLGVADTKGAIYDALPADGVAVINADDAFAPYFAERAHGRRLIRYGLDATADVTAHAIDLLPDSAHFTLVTPIGEVEVGLSMAGRHNVLNALAAASIALGAGIEPDVIAEGLAKARPVAGRLVTHRLQNGAIVIDDSYNANPGSLNAAIDTLASSGDTAWLVLGDMRELGADAELLHAEAGRRAKSAGIARLYALGPLSKHAVDAFGEDGHHFDTHAALAQSLASGLREGVRVLVKGSRGSAMDKIVSALLRDEGNDPHAA
ncbi:UDP-N-acetylmuramoyl-tripeptide--D-alanyl-D-alanine ligase [Noviluteimonas gilva]|uniref:UDP-N-acetylmuramoyl-tripeptide--D-alanyl-D-alanine ligase n=1 Tax=Noviluteimonas gilva TaxID=2682097 RepID=A0A7C9HLK6_9GAMM|nr:UDP-N-acetylmuramoyl-tripeptide--D-alanyl-D-alanine ligase [Lysobacter gilvus]MUV13797.1 UDP-N-acetylmuramoyl-tripeptide--D-alanyl-D-alanine ligase [Lysobacter gilvus]